MWHDGHLVRLGSMDDYGIWQIEHDFKAWGLKPKRDYGFYEPWAEINPEGIPMLCAALKGKADAALVSSDNFQAFLRGEVKALRRRATAIVRSNNNCVLLVRDKGKAHFSLPGGKIEKDEVALAAAIRELHEELGLRANKAERLTHCDYEATSNRHLVCQIHSNDSPHINNHELDEYYWWDGKQNIPRYPHVDHILSNARIDF